MASLAICDKIKRNKAYRTSLHSQFFLAEVLASHFANSGEQNNSPSGLWEKLRVPRGKRKAGAARQAEAKGLWARA
jgi:hypothetical protein